nr:hypothetical protein CFP56_69553 [Quercus suber]
MTLDTTSGRMQFGRPLGISGRILIASTIPIWLRPFQRQDPPPVLRIPQQVTLMILEINGTKFRQPWQFGRKSHHRRRLATKSCGGEIKGSRFVIDGAEYRKSIYGLIMTNTGSRRKKTTIVTYRARNVMRDLVR